MPVVEGGDSHRDESGESISLASGLAVCACGILVVGCYVYCRAEAFAYLCTILARLGVYR